MPLSELDKLLLGEPEPKLSEFDKLLLGETPAMEPEEEPTFWEEAWKKVEGVSEWWRPEPKIATTDTWYRGKLYKKGEEMPQPSPIEKTIEEVKSQWEADWPEWIGLAITTGLGVVISLPAVQSRILTKAADKFGARNFNILKQRFPKNIKTPEDAKAMAETALRNYAGEVTKQKYWVDLSPTSKTQMISKIAKSVEDVTLKATPEITKAITGTGKALNIYIQNPQLGLKTVGDLQLQLQKLLPQLPAVVNKLVTMGSGTLPIERRDVLGIVIKNEIDDKTEQQLHNILGTSGKIIPEKMAPEERIDTEADKIVAKEMKKEPDIAPKIPEIDEAISVAKNSKSLEQFKNNLISYIENKEVRGLPDWHGVQPDEVQMGMAEVENIALIHTEQLMDKIARQYGSLKKFYDTVKEEKPEIAPKAEVPTIPPTEPPTIPPRVPPSDVPKIPGEPEIDPIDKLNELIKAAKPMRGEIERAYSEERGKRIAEVDKFIKDTIDTVGGEEGYKAVLSKLKGELIDPEAKPRFEPVEDKLTEEELKSLYLKTWNHQYLNTFEKVTSAKGLTDLFMGEIPPPSTLVLMEEVYGSELIKNLLSKRLWGAKATDFALEAANIPRALLATADMSAFLRQGVIEIAAHPIISTKAMAKTFEFAFKPETFEQYYSKDLKEHRHYDLMRKSKVAITDPRKPVGEREEPFISRILQKVPVLKIPVEFAERAYTGFLTKLRVDVFSLWADELLGQGKSPVKDKRLFDAAATVVNTFTGRGSLGKGGNRIAPQLNAIFFSPRLIAARFNAMNPVWYAKQPPEIRKKALGDFAKFVIAGTTTLALIKLASMDNDDFDVETDPRSADFGKVRVGNTRFDIWGGHQQFARAFTQIIMGERKSSTTGEIMSLNKDEYPFSTRQDVLYRFIEGKLAPGPALIRELMAGAKTFEGEDITIQSVATQKLIPMYIQDILDAYRDGGLGITIPTGALAFFGIGVQTYGKRKAKKRYVRPY